MDIRVYPGKLNGQISAIPSKSAAHRAILASALADKPTQLKLTRAGGLSQDIEATINCVRVLGAEVGIKYKTIDVRPIGQTKNEALLDCGESGTTLRFILPVVAALGKGFSVTGQGRLAERPLADLCLALEAHGCICSSHTIPLSVRGKLQGGDFVLPGGISSQYISGLLLAIPVLGTGSRIMLASPLESSGYVDLTCSVMNTYDVETLIEDNCFTVAAAPYHSPCTFNVEGDWSNAAFWLAAQSLGSKINVTGLDAASCQPDRAVTTLIPCLGGDAAIDVADCPDLMPILAIVAASTSGSTHFINAARLRLKESDRIAGVAQGLSSLGVTVSEQPDGLTVSGGRLAGGEVSGCNDHRLVMSWAIAALVAEAPIVIHGAEAVAKSYPDFWQDYQKLGGKFDVL